ncbi:LOW QUALITY PROTEIN: ornithine carbamoyltransferase, partial [Mycobacterium tuberculosis T46]
HVNVRGSEGFLPDSSFGRGRAPRPGYGASVTVTPTTTRTPPAPTFWSPTPGRRWARKTTGWTE